MPKHLDSRRSVHTRTYVRIINLVAPCAFLLPSDSALGYGELGDEIPNPRPHLGVPHSQSLSFLARKHRRARRSCSILPSYDALRRIQIEVRGHPTIVIHQRPMAGRQMMGTRWIQPSNHSWKSVLQSPLEPTHSNGRYPCGLWSGRFIAQGHTGRRNQHNADHWAGQE